jgi:hypothetical protein
VTQCEGLHGFRIKVGKLADVCEVFIGKREPLAGANDFHSTFQEFLSRERLCRVSNRLKDDIEP